MPKISILTPSFNSIEFIEQAITSVLKQNYDDFEHIIVDGGSKDGTVEVLKKYKHLNWISEPDKGQSDAMNKAFEMSCGDIITYLNVDDYYETGAFSLVSNYFQNHDSCDMIVGIVQMHMPDGIRIINTSADHSYRKICLHFKNDFPYNPVGYFYRRKVQNSIGPFPIENHFSMDYWFLLKAYKYHNVQHSLILKLLHRSPNN
jgi:glycosyltransferase involved in cell wall biosynthesis